MKLFKLKIFSGLLLFLSLGAMEVERAYLSEQNLPQIFPSSEGIVYAKLGLTSLIPTIGLGVRSQYGSHGWDLSGQVGTLLFIGCASAKALYLYYPMQGDFYLGCGAGCWCFGDSRGNIEGSLEQVLGIQWANKRCFFQLEVSEFTIGGSRVDLTPALFIGFGF